MFAFCPKRIQPTSVPKLGEKIDVVEARIWCEEISRVSSQILPVGHEGNRQRDVRNGEGIGTV
jgi:hypothetical protein